MATASIESVVIAAIKPSLLQVQDRITPVKRDDNGLLPAIVYESGLAQRPMMLSGSYSDIATVNIQFTVFARTYFSAKELLGQLATAVNAARGFNYLAPPFWQRKPVALQSKTSLIQTACFPHHLSRLSNSNEQSHIQA